MTAVIRSVFSNPNPVGNIKTMEFLCACADAMRAGDAASAAGRPCSLLELYCGFGNHSVALAAKFDSITAVEIQPRLVELAQLNMAVCWWRRAVPSAAL